MKLTSPVFADQEPIPERYSHTSGDVSPPLEWADLPPGTEQLALVVEDPDAPQDVPFVHWVVYGIPASAGSLPEGLPREPAVTKPVHAVQGANDFGETGYGGPAPPKGHGTHHYHFKLYALAGPAPAEPGLTKLELREAIGESVLDEAELVGTFER